MWNQHRRFRNKVDNLLHLRSNFSARRIAELRSLDDGTVNVSAVYAAKGMHFNTTRAPDVFNDWVFVASYVNNFVHTARSLECDAFLGAEFDSALCWPAFCEEWCRIREDSHL